MVAKMVLKLTIVLQTLLLLDYVLAAPVAVTVNVMDKQRRKQFLLSGVDDEKTVGEIKDEVLGQRDITGQPKLPNATFEPGAKSLVNESFADDTKLKQFIRRIPLRTVKVNVD